MNTAALYADHLRTVLSRYEAALARDRVKTIK